MKYCGLFNILKCCLAKYSPIIPIVNNCTPEKMAIIDAKNGKPGTGDPSIKNLPRTKNNTHSPKNEKTKPIMLAICNGITLKPVIILNPCCTNLLNV